MTDIINLGGPRLSDFLDRIGPSQAARNRVFNIDRILADELVNGQPDVSGCADLVHEAANLISDANPPGLDWSAWDDF